jgi:hypothetical protein
MTRRRVSPSRCHCPHREAARHRPLLCHKARGSVGAQAARAATHQNTPARESCLAATLGRRPAFLSYLCLNPAGRKDLHAALRAALSALPHPAALVLGCTTLQSTVRARSTTHPPGGPAPGKPDKSMVKSLATIPTSTNRTSMLSTSCSTTRARRRRRRTTTACSTHGTSTTPAIQKP